MSETPSNRNKPLSGGGPSERFKPWVVWLFIISAIVLLFSFSNPNAPTAREWTLNQVVQAAEKEQIESATIESNPTGGLNWSEIRGELKESYAPDGQTAFIAKGRLTDDMLGRLQATGVFKEKPASTLMRDVLLTLLPFILIVGLLYFLITRQMKMAGRGAMSFGKSRARMLTRDREKVTFSDVAGCEEAIADVHEMVEFLRDPKKFQKIGGRIPKGCLLVGPPGTGKTLLARAVAGEADVPFFSISGSDFVEMFVGVGAARVRDMFEQGRKQAPCIIFIDEIDAVGRQRGAGLGGGNDEREQTLNSLLVEMDGFDAYEGVIIMAATNRPDVLDNALLRPGRFDRQVVIDLPDLAGRQKILEVHVKKIKTVDDLDMEVVARSTPGFSGADLANLLNEAALLAARRGRERVTLLELDEARDKIAFGRERRRVMDDEDKRLIAYHEAGHALVAAVIDDGHLPIHKVTIIPRGQSLGSTMYVPKKDILNETKNQIVNRVCWGVGGRVAEELVFEDITTGAGGDIKMVTNLARRMVCDWGMSELGFVAYGENQEHLFLGREIQRQQNYSEATAQRVDATVREIIETQHARARKILQDNREALDMVAEALLQYETIEGKHVHEILEYGEMKSPVMADAAKEAEERTIKAEEERKKAEKEKKSEEDLGQNPTPAPA